MKLSEVQGIPFALLDWNDLDILTRKLFDLVSESGIEYDRIVPLANGGLTIARHFADLAGINKISPIQIALYEGIDRRRADPQVKQPLSVPIHGERVLILEDIVDTGTTLTFAQNQLRQKGAADLRSASLFCKSHTTQKPDYYAQLLDRWIIFPYETRETIEELSQKWGGRDHIEEVGFDPADVKRFSLVQ